jgi:hypothetical protein
VVIGSLEHAAMPSMTDRRHERWAHLRHQIIGVLLAASPRRGELRAALEALAAKTYRHPITGEPVRLAFSTVERWLHLARKAAGHGDTVRALRRKVRKDAGTRRAASSAVVVAIVAQHKAHPTWSYKLHADNLVALVVLGELVGRVPSYTTVRRLMKERGLLRQKRRQRRGNAAARDLVGRGRRLLPHGLPEPAQCAPGVCAHGRVK